MIVTSKMQQGSMKLTKNISVLQDPSQNIFYKMYFIMKLIVYVLMNDVLNISNGNHMS